LQTKNGAHGQVQSYSYDYRETRFKGMSYEKAAIAFTLADGANYAQVAVTFIVKSGLIGCIHGANGGIS